MEAGCHFDVVLEDHWLSELLFSAEPVYASCGAQIAG